MHSRTADDGAVACAFDLLMVNDDDLRWRPLVEHNAALSKLLIRSRGGIQYVEPCRGDRGRKFEALCKLGLEGIASKRLTSPYRSGPSRAWINVKNPKAAATRVLELGF